MNKRQYFKWIVILIVLSVYYFAVGKYTFDLYSFFAHYEVGSRPILESRTWEGCDLFPWPLDNLPKPRGSELIVWSSRPLTLSEIFVRDYCYEVPIVTVSLIILPMILIHIHYYERRLLLKRLLVSSVILFGIGTTIWISSSLMMQRATAWEPEREWWWTQHIAYHVPLAIVFFATGVVTCALILLLKFSSRFSHY